MRDAQAASGRSTAGHGIRLADFQPQDLPAIHAFAADPVVCQYSTWGPNQLADTREFLADALLEQPHRVLQAVMLGDVLIGSASVWVTDRKAKAGEIGYTLNREYWGNGYAAETAGLLLRRGFEDLGLERISATCDARNAASIRVLEKTGFKLEGRRVEDPDSDAARAETLIFNIGRT
ncbi:GNAT family N-acetyltransferase [Arthrobacter sp. MYb214]|nr:GNAT family N-acetyltransferase [Arthrobacter sp. MYb222]PRB78704.1 GNAT family N-acetyltransferase [Arthrobacter sp. MYb214]